MYLAEDKLRALKGALNAALQKNDIDGFIKIFSTARAENNVDAEILTMAASEKNSGEKKALINRCIGAGNGFIRQGDHAQALCCAKYILAIEEKNLAGRLMAAGCYMNLKDYQLGKAMAEAALKIQPDNIQAMVILAHCYKNLQKHKAENEILQKAYCLAKQKGFTELFSGEACSLLGSLNTLLGDSAAACRYFKESSELEKDRSQAAAEYSNYLFAANYRADLSDDELLKMHCEYNKFFTDIERFKHSLHCHKKIRLGYVSADFHRHPVMYYLMALLTNYSRDKFIVYCYDSGDCHDAITEKAKESVDAWREIAHMDDRAAAELIYSDEIDILFDLGGHTARNRLGVFAYKPAPIQVAGIGYFHSTGLKEMDYFLTDAHCTKEKDYEKFSERPLVLPHSHWCYAPLSAPPSVNSAPCLKNGYVTFGTFNNFNKANDEVLKLWSEILRKVENSRLILKSRLFMSEEGLEYAKARLAKAGISLEKTELRGMSDDYLAEYGDIDICVDTFPYQGGATTCEALYMGVPVLVLAGTRHGSRFGVSMMENIGCAELVAVNKREYVKKAVQLAKNKTRLKRYRQELREKMEKSPLMRKEKYVAAVEAKYKEIWEIYFANKGNEYVAMIEEGMGQGQYRKVLTLCHDLRESLPTGEDKQHEAQILVKEGEVYKELGEPKKAAAKDMQAFETASGEDKKGAGMWYRLMMIDLHYNSYDFKEMLQYHKIYEDIQPPAKAFTKWRENNTGKIRIGYISSDFKRHVMQNFYMAFLRSYDKDSFTVTCYMLEKGDEYTEKLKSYVDEWRNLSSYSTSEAAEIIHNDGQDILVDLTGFTGQFALDILKWRPSPIQLSGLGYIDFLDLSYIDYCIGDAQTAGNLPDEYRKKCIEMPNGLFCYTPYQTAELDAQCAWEKCGFITFGSFNNLSKANDEVLALWGKIMQRVPNSRLMLKANAFHDREFAEIYRAKLQSFGIIRAELRPSGWEYLHEYNDMDIALDTFPWNGGGTTCDALYMGTPVIALEGKAFGDNYAASILKSAGLGELVAKNETEYIELAVELAKDKAALKSLQQNLRTIIEKSPLMNEKMYVKDMEKIYRRLYGKQGKR